MTSEVRFPITIKVRTGDGGPARDIVTLREACDFLIDWPEAKRDDFYRSARDTLVAAMKHSAEPADAQNAFAAFCRHFGILTRG